MFDTGGNVIFLEPVLGKVDPERYASEKINLHYRTFEIYFMLFTVAKGET